MTPSASVTSEKVSTWTILRPSSFLTNATRWSSQLRAGDVVAGPFGGVPVAVVDPTDVGAVAALTLT